MDQPLELSKRLKIAIAEDDRDTREIYTAMLTAIGHEVIGAAENGKELVKLCESGAVDLAIIDIKMPEMDGIQAADHLVRTAALPIVLVSGHYDEKFTDRAGLSNVMAYLIKPVTLDGLKAAISVAMRRFDEFNRMVNEANTLRQALQDRKLIERAKGILMEQANLSETDAFRRLQKLAWDRNEKLVKIAETIILAKTAIDGGGFNNRMHVNVGTTNSSGNGHQHGNGKSDHKQGRAPSYGR